MFCGIFCCRPFPSSRKARRELSLMGVRKYSKAACLPRHDHDFGGHPGMEFTPVQFVPFGGIDGYACEKIGGAGAFVGKAVRRDAGDLAFQRGVLRCLNAVRRTRALRPIRTTSIVYCPTLPNFSIARQNVCQPSVDTPVGGLIASPLGPL
jgi:hypothetical protein